jgi:hypothetical protein
MTNPRGTGHPPDDEPVPGVAAVPPLLRELLRPRRQTLAVILAAMLVQMAMSLTAPWPLKVILDNVAGSHPPPK